MKTKRVTIKDIAEQAGVSKATASLVLNGRGKELRVAQETRERVLAIAREQHYQPSIHARSLRDNRSHTIGLVVPEITNHGFAVFSHELEMLCREAGVQLLISCTDENPGQESVVVNNMIARQVDGMIDETIRDFPFVRRENKSLFIDLDEALQGRIKGIRVKEFSLADGTVTIAF